MSELNPQTLASRPKWSTRRKTAAPQKVRLSGPTLVATEPLYRDKGLPLLVRPAEQGVDLVRWAIDQATLLQDLLVDPGGILFRGFLSSGWRNSKLSFAASPANRSPIVSAHRRSSSCRTAFGHRRVDLV